MPKLEDEYATISRNHNSTKESRRLTSQEIKNIKEGTANQRAEAADATIPNLPGSDNPAVSNRLRQPINIVASLDAATERAITFWETFEPENSEVPPVDRSKKPQAGPPVDRTTKPQVDAREDGWEIIGKNECVLENNVKVSKGKWSSFATKTPKAGNNFFSFSSSSSQKDAAASFQKNDGDREPTSQWYVHSIKND